MIVQERNAGQTRRKNLFLRFYDPITPIIPFIFARGSIEELINAAFTILGLPAAGGFITNLIIIVLFSNAFPAVVRSITNKHFIGTLAFSFVYVISYLIARDKEVHHLVLSSIFPNSVMYFLVGLSVKEYDDIWAGMRLSAIVVLANAFIKVFITRSAFLLYVYSQDIGYAMVFCGLVFYCYSLTNKKIIDIVCFVLSGVVLLAVGARGPLLSLLLGVILSTVFVIDVFHGWKLIALITIFSIIGFVIYFFYNNILTMLYQLFSTRGVSTRVINGLLSGNIAESQGRNNIASFAWNYILHHPFWGTGFVNERRLIYDSGIYVNSNPSVFGLFCHNFYLELMMQFGLFPGIIIGISFSIYMLKRVIRSRGATRNVLIVCIGFCFFQLMVSKSYIHINWFYLLLGIITSRELLKQERTNSYNEAYV